MSPFQPQCSDPGGQCPVPAGDPGGLWLSPLPRGPGPRLGPAQPLLDRLGPQDGRGGLGLRRPLEEGAGGHGTQRAQSHSPGPPARVSVGVCGHVGATTS